MRSENWTCNRAPRKARARRGRRQRPRMRRSGRRVSTFPKWLYSRWAARHVTPSQYLSLSVFRRKSHIFADNSVGWHLATNSFHQHVRLLMEISPHTFFRKNISIRWRNMCSMASFCAEFWVLQVQNDAIETHIPASDRNVFSEKKSMGRYLHEQAHMLVKGICC